MKASDWTRFIYVIFIFIILHTFIIFVVQFENIKKIGQDTNVIQ